MPSRCASSFMRSAKPATLPPTASATATAMSFADFTIIIFSALSSVSTVPGLKPILLGGCGGGVARCRRPANSSVISPAATARNTT